jgi:hypothetical protein
MDPSGGDPEIKRAVRAVLEEAMTRILEAADRYSDPTEREYRGGMRDARFIVRMLLEDVMEQTKLKRSGQ